jgi:hypothetical protein
MFTKIHGKSILFFMNNKFFAVLVVGGLLCGFFFFLGCGQSGGGGGGGGGGNVTISGSLYSGTITSRSLRASGISAQAEPASPLAGYQVVGISSDKRIYYPDADTGSDGSFTISSLPAGVSFYLVLLYNGQYVAPVAFGQSGGWIVMGVTCESGSSTINVGQIVYDSLKKSGVTSIEVSDKMLDWHASAEALTGELFVPVGAIDKGRGTGEAYFTGTLVDHNDEDYDGLPDVVDIDDNGDGKVDGLDDNPRISGGKEMEHITGADFVNVFSDFGFEYESCPSYISGSFNNERKNIGTNTVYAVELIMESGYSPSYFSEVKVVDGPAWLASATIFNPAGDTQLWSSTNYALTAGTDRWDVHIHPNVTPEVGDVLKFQVTPAAGGTPQYMMFTLTYNFIDIPKLLSYEYSGTTKSGSDLNLSTYVANSNMFDFDSTTEVTFKWIAPLDDQGNRIADLDWYFDGIVYHRADGSMFNAGSLAISASAVPDPDFGTAYVYTYTPTTEAYSYFKVDIKGVSPVPGTGRGSAYQSVNFKKI